MWVGTPPVDGSGPYPYPLILALGAVKLPSRFGIQCHYLPREAQVNEQTVLEPPQQDTEETLTGAEMLIEEVSIDGMCGVY
jgi:mycofactocin precursor